MKHANDLILVLREANQVVNPKLSEMAEMAKSGGLGGKGGKRMSMSYYIYSKTCLEWNLKGPEHFSAEARFPFNQGIL
jgi:hypothetical protein